MFKLKKTPSGKRLWTYMAAILEVTGMMQGHVYPLKRFLGNFQTHLDNGRIVAAPGGFKLTSTGIDYFRDRYAPDSPQHIERAEVDTMIQSLRSGVGPDEWVAVI